MVADPHLPPISIYSHTGNLPYFWKVGISLPLIVIFDIETQTNTCLLALQISASSAQTTITHPLPVPNIGPNDHVARKTVCESPNGPGKRGIW